MNLITTTCAVAVVTLVGCAPTVLERHYRAAVLQGAITLTARHDYELFLPPWSGHIKVPRGARISLIRSDAAVATAPFFERECQRWSYPKRQDIRDWRGKTVGTLCSTSQVTVASGS